MNKYDIAIIGAGAAGCMAAIHASKKGKNVILIERNDKIGKKLLATGNGRCNLTNINAHPSYYHGANSEFIGNVLDKFNPQKTMEYFESLGLLLKVEDAGRIFPRSNQAESVVSALEEELSRQKITIKTNSLVRKIEKNDFWTILLENKLEINAEKIILTTGGKAAYQYGSSGDGYFWAEKLGHEIIPTFPALLPIEIKEEWIKLAKGIKVEGKVVVTENGKNIAEKNGDILFTHFGLSGPAVMAVARNVSTQVQNKIKIHLDIFPDTSSQTLDEKIKKIINLNGAKSIKNCLSGAIPANLAYLIIKNLGINPDKKSAELSKTDRRKIVERVKNIELTPIKVRSFKEAQVTAGGIDTKKIDSDTMESKLIKNLYFAGEIVDVDGDSGGYNLQWAWSSGYLAGISAAK